MNRHERALLRETVNAVARHHPNAWWELKWQIYDGGSRSYYPAQGEFNPAASRTVYVPLLRTTHLPGLHRLLEIRGDRLVGIDQPLLATDHAFQSVEKLGGDLISKLKDQRLQIFVTDRTRFGGAASGRKINHPLKRSGNEVQHAIVLSR